MTTVEIDLPPTTETKIARLVEQGEFTTQERAIEELLSTGLQAYQVNDTEESNEDEWYGDDMMGHDDEYVF